MPVYTVFVARHNCATSKITPEAKLYMVEDAARSLDAYTPANTAPF
jgi:hypothetical protein